MMMTMIASQKARNFFYPNRHTLAIFSLLSLLGIGFILLQAYGRVSDPGWLLLLELVVYATFPVWIAIEPMAYQSAHLPIAASLVFCYLYLLACTASYALRWFKRIGSPGQPTSNQATTG
ncbi:hypothetical protein [Nitrososphaera sp.]|uniref:hypothetical protein n=1 Tax=Nitrososphaera sp. TaxID=1971748 RepID=UPI00307DC2A8